jgi:hypothetical protein
MACLCCGIKKSAFSEKAVMELWVEEKQMCRACVRTLEVEAEAEALAAQWKSEESEEESEEEEGGEEEKSF